MHTATLLIVEPTGSFSTLWLPVAREIGWRVRLATDTGSTIAGAATAAALVAARGDERWLEPLLGDLSTRAVAAAVLDSCDHRRAVILMRTGASDVFVVDRDADALRDWLVASLARASSSGARAGRDADAASNRLSTIIHRAAHDTLERCGGSKSDAARRLGISRTRLQRLLAGASRAEGPASLTTPA